MLIYIIRGVPIYIVEEYAHITSSGVCLFTLWRNMLIYIIRGVHIYIVEEYAHINNQGCAYLHCGGICSYI